MKQLFLDIKAQLVTKLGDALPFIDIWNNQLQNMESQELYTFPLPAVFIEFIQLGDIQDLGMGYQIYNDMTVRVHIVHQQLDAGDNTMDRDVAVFDLKDLIFKALHHFEPSQSASFSRTSETQDTNHTNIYHFIQDYQTNYVDVKAKQPETTIPTTPPTTLEVDAVRVAAIT